MSLVLEYAYHVIKNSVKEFAQGILAFVALFVVAGLAFTLIGTVFGLCLWTISCGEVVHQQTTPFEFIDLVFCGFLFFVMLAIYVTCIKSAIDLARKHVSAYRRFCANPTFGCDQGEPFR